MQRTIIHRIKGGTEVKKRVNRRVQQAAVHYKSSAGVSHGIAQYSPSIGGFGALWHIGGSGRQGIQASPGASGEWEQPDGSRETSPGSGENNSWPATTEEIAEISQPSWHMGPMNGQRSGNPHLQGNPGTHEASESTCAG